MADKVAEGNGVVPFPDSTDRWSHHSITDVFEKSLFSDCTVLLANDSVFRGHILILASACAFFEKAFCGDFVEGLEKKLDLSDEDPELVMALLRYIYGYTYDAIINMRGVDYLTWHVQLYALADRVGYEKLKGISAAHLQKHVNDNKLEYTTFSSPLFLMEDCTPPGDVAMRAVAKAYTKANIDNIKKFTWEEHEMLSGKLPRYSADIVEILSTPPPAPPQKYKKWRCYKNDYYGHSGSTHHTFTLDKRPSHCPYCGTNSVVEVGSWRCPGCWTTREPGDDPGMICACGHSWKKVWP